MAKRFDNVASAALGGNDMSPRPSSGAKVRDKGRVQVSTLLPYDYYYALDEELDRRRAERRRSGERGGRLVISDVLADWVGAFLTLPVERRNALCVDVTGMRAERRRKMFEDMSDDSVIESNETAGRRNYRAGFRLPVDTVDSINEERTRLRRLGELNPSEATATTVMCAAIKAAMDGAIGTGGEGTSPSSSGTMPRLKM